MKEISLESLPPCFEKWCLKFDDLWENKAKKTGFRCYLAGLLGESKRKNIVQITDNIVGSSYHNVHHFVGKSKWNTDDVNERRLQIMNKRNQTRIRNGFTLIVDDSGHVKSGNFTDGVGRQYIGEIGKTDNGIVTVTTHLYDGVRSLPLDIELYQHADSLPEGKKDKDFIKKPDLALKLIKKTIQRKFHPGIILIDGGYGNNSNFLRGVEELNLTYIGGLAKNRLVKVIKQKTGKKEPEKRLDEITLSLPKNNFQAVTIELNQPKTVWVATIKVEITGLEGERTIAIVMNASSPESATEIDYLITNSQGDKVTGEWIVKTFSQRNYIEKFYREACMLARLKRIPNAKKRAVTSSLYFSFYCLYIYYLSAVNGRIEKTLR
ncbi:MAG: IS701 family transposase [Xenococcaceae cyanobacterium]